MSKFALTRVAFALAAVSFYAGEASAQLSKWRAVQSAPEIDGPAGVAAIALLASAGIMAYRRLRK